MIIEWGVGEEMPSIEEVWRQYYRRFTVDYWYRFLKQRLHVFTLPVISLSSPKSSKIA